MKYANWLKREEALLNARTGEVRYVWRDGLRPDIRWVVKFFDPVQKERWTAKVFSGCYKAVKSHWRTHVPLPPDKQNWDAAEDVLDQVVASVR